MSYVDKNILGPLVHMHGDQVRSNCAVCFMSEQYTLQYGYNLKYQFQDYYYDSFMTKE